MVYRKTNATEERKGARRRLFLDSAIGLFGKHGYHATTVPMIVADTGSSTGSFYMYFRNKEDVFNAALEEVGKAITGALNAVRETERDALKRIPQAIEALFLLLAQNPEHARILIIESSGLSPRLDKTRRGIILQQKNALQKDLESARGLLAVDNAAIAAQCIVGATYEALYSWMEESPRGRMSVTEVAGIAARLITRLVKKVPAKD